MTFNEFSFTSNIVSLFSPSFPHWKQWVVDWLRCINSWFPGRYKTLSQPIWSWESNLIETNKFKYNFFLLLSSKSSNDSFVCWCWVYHKIRLKRDNSTSNHDTFESLTFIKNFSSSWNIFETFPWKIWKQSRKYHECQKNKRCGKVHQKNKALTFFISNKFLFHIFW